MQCWPLLLILSHPTRANVKTSELYQVPVEEPDDYEEEPTVTYTDDDFWEAIELLEVSRNAITSTLKYGESIPRARRKLLENLHIDISMYLSYFIEVTDSEETEE